jgi:hypothetical protein
MLSPLVTPKRNNAIKLTSSRHSQSDLISITPKIVSFTNFTNNKVKKHIRSISYLPSLPTKKNSSYNTTIISSLSKPSLQGLCNVIGKVLNGSVNLESGIRRSKVSKSKYYNKFLVKGYEKVSESESSCESIPQETHIFADDKEEQEEQQQVDKIDDTATKINKNKIKKMKTLSQDLSKIATIDFINLRSPTKNKRLTQRVSSNLQNHIEAIRTINQLDIFQKIEINRSKIEKLAQKQRTHEMGVDRITDPNKQVKVFKKLYTNELTTYVNYIRSTRKEKYDYITKLDNGDIIKEELEGNMLLPGTLMKDTNKLVSLQPRYVKAKFNRHFNIAELNEGNMMDIMLKHKLLL